MFSRLDIQKALGKDIVFFPFKEENIKENSLNLTVSKFAWTLTDESQCTTKKEEHSKQQLSNGSKTCCVNKGGKEYIILYPFSTTLVITNEFLALGKSIGGTIHSRVGTANLGVGHISTMLGPSYMGKLCVPLHNPTQREVHLEVGSPFLSIIFYHLKTSVKESNHTSQAHINKFPTWGIYLTDKESEAIYNEDLKDIRSCAEKMKLENAFKAYAKKHSWKERFYCTIRDWCSPRNCIILLLFIFGVVLLVVSFFFNFTDSITKIRETLVTAILLLVIQLIPDRR